MWCFTHMPTAALLRSLQWVSYRRVPPGHCASHAWHSASTHGIAHLHMAQCISHMTQPSPIAPPMFRDAGPTIRNPLQAAKQRSCGISQTPLCPIPYYCTNRTVNIVQYSCKYLIWDGFVKFLPCLNLQKLEKNM